MGQKPLLTVSLQICVICVICGSISSRHHPRCFVAAFSISAASLRVVSLRDSPRSISASSSTRASRSARGVMVVVVRLPVVVLRIVHWCAA